MEVGARTPAAPFLAEAMEARAAVAGVAGLTVVEEAVVEEAPTSKCHPRTASHRKA